MVGGAHEAGQRALAEAERLEHLGPLVVVELRGLGLELHAHADHLGAIARPADTGSSAATGATSSSVRSSSSSPTLTTASTGLLVSRKYGRSSSRSVASRSPR